MLCDTACHRVGGLEMDSKMQTFDVPSVAYQMWIWDQSLRKAGKDWQREGSDGTGSAGPPVKADLLESAGLSLSKAPPPQPHLAQSPDAGCPKRGTTSGRWLCSQGSS